MFMLQVLSPVKVPFCIIAKSKSCEVLILEPLRIHDVSCLRQQCFKHVLVAKQLEIIKKKRQITRKRALRTQKVS